MGGGVLICLLCIFKDFCCAYCRVWIMCIYFLYISVWAFLGVDINANLPDPAEFNISLTPKCLTFL